MLQRADLQLEVAAFDPAAWLALDGAFAPSLRIDGTLHCKTRGDVDLRAALRASTDRIDEVGQPMHATVALRADARSTVVQCLHASLGSAGVQGTARVECTPLALLDGVDAFTTAVARADLQLLTLPLEAVPQHTLRALSLDELRGMVSAHARLLGTIASPSVTASVQVADASVRTTGGERLDDITATLALASHTAHLVGTASRGKAPLSLTCQLRAHEPLWRAGASAELTLALHGSNVLLYRQAGVRVRADLDITARGRLDDIVVNGSVGLRYSRLVTRVPLLDLRRSGGAAASTGFRLPAIELPAPLRARLDVDITTKEPFVAKTNLLEGNLYAQLQLLGPLSAPRLQGTVTGVDATVILPGMRLRASALLLQFTTESPELPTLTLNARGRRHGYDVQVTARGRYDRPEIEFTSDPPLPPDELVVLVTTGTQPSSRDKVSKLRFSRGMGARRAAEVVSVVRKRCSSGVVLRAEGRRSASVQRLSTGRFPRRLGREVGEAEQARSSGEGKRRPRRCSRRSDGRRVGGKNEV